MNDEYWMRQAITLAEAAAIHNEVPVGAIVVKDGELVGRGFNQPIMLNDPSAHAEMQALRDAASNITNYRLIDCTMYVTLEPCIMCAGAIVHSRIKRLVFGATEPKAGAIVSQVRQLDAAYLNHKTMYEGGVCADECGQIIRRFFSRRRKEKSKKNNSIVCK